jgi:hypothetical protein
MILFVQWGRRRMVSKLSSALTEPNGVKREKAMKEKNNLRPRLEKMKGRLDGHKEQEVTRL